MNIHSRLRQIEKIIASKRLDTAVHFFDSEEEYQETTKYIGKNDVVFIEDVPKHDEREEVG